MEQITIQAKDGLLIQATIFHVENAKGIVQIIHGAKEHQARYFHFAKYLQTKGFAVITSDNRGHGSSVNDEFPLGFMDGMKEIIDDQLLVTKKAEDMYPNKPLSLLGHSLGSVFARCYIQEHDANIEKLILSGTVNYVPGVSFGIMLGKLIASVSGKRGYNKFLERLSLKNQKDDLWISVSEENLTKYRNDPLCQYDYQNQAVITIFEAVKQMQNIAAYKCSRPELSILSISGEGDPITGGEKGLRHSIQTLEKVGYSDIKNIVYPNMNHEVLNEDEKETVYRDVLHFLLA
ncbi:MAG TPA: alpha/beta hydrolase [Bacillota bacterium]|nr:alpha/beta hydrolase [Bacillota bacterium]